MKQKTTFLTSGNTYLNQVILALMLIISTASFSQVAPVLFPNGGFNIDGNLDSDTSVGDWLGTRPNSFVFDIYPAFPFGDALRASPVTAVSTFRVIDAYDGNDDIQQRMNMMVEEIERLTHLKSDPAKWQQWYSNIREIITYKKKLLLTASLSSNPSSCNTLLVHPMVQ